MNIENVNFIPKYRQQRKPDNQITSIIKGLMDMRKNQNKVAKICSQKQADISKVSKNRWAAKQLKLPF